MKVHPLGETTAYQVFGVSLDFDQELLDAMHKSMVRKHHPDRGGDPAVFLQYQVAYEILSDPAQRLDEKAREQKRLNSMYGATIPTLNTPPPSSTQTTTKTSQPKTYTMKAGQPAYKMAFKRKAGTYTLYDTKKGPVFHGIMLAFFFVVNAFLFAGNGGGFEYDALILSFGLANVLATLPWSFKAARYLASKRGGFFLLVGFYLFGIFALIASFWYGLLAATAVFIGSKIYKAVKVRRAATA
jgi:uncharacterized membrane protein